MSVFLYAFLSNSFGDRFQRVVGGLVPGKKLEIYQSIEKLFRRLRQPFYRELIGVFQVADQQELSEFLAHRDMLNDLRFILVLPDNKKSTVSKAHKLYPRFISYTDENFSDVAAVLKKMLSINYVWKWPDNYKEGHVHDFYRNSEKKGATA